MRPSSFMLIAGEASGDRLAAELVAALRTEWQRRFGNDRSKLTPSLNGAGPAFFGAGGPAMHDAGVDIIEDMTHRAVIGVSDVLRRIPEFGRLMKRLEKLALDRQPAAIISVDYGGFNLRFQSRIRRQLRSRSGPFNNWTPKQIQFVSPQVWASRPGRAFRMAKNLDLLISILPFEKDWFAHRTPNLKVEFVGHPLIGRHAGLDTAPPQNRSTGTKPPLIALLPGSRPGELRHHLPLIRDAVRLIRQQIECRFKLVVPTDGLAQLARSTIGNEPVEIVVGSLAPVLNEAALALSKTGTITLELALFGVPSVTFYRTTPATYWIARSVVSVKWLSMPNLLANEPVFPEFVQQAATGQALADAALALLRDDDRPKRVTAKLAELVRQLGSPGAPDRAARAVLDLFRDDSDNESGLLS